jgi:hypothetical protein
MPSYRFLIMISFSLMPYLILRSWRSTQSLLDMTVFLFTDSLSRSAIFSISCVLFFCFCHKLIFMLLSSLHDCEFRALGDSTTMIFVDSVLTALQWNTMTYHKSTLICTAFVFFFRLVGLIGRARVECFPVLPQSRALHGPLMTGHFALALIFVYYFGISWEEGHTYRHPLGCFRLRQTIAGFCDCLHTMLKHAIYLSDLDCGASSLWAIDLSVFFELLFPGLRVLISLTIASASASLLIPDATMTEDLAGFIRRLIHFWEWRHLLRQLDQSFPAPTPDEITDLCIVCRLPMAVSDSKVLPCRHCCHLACIHRWASQQTICPLCGHDLVPTLGPADDSWPAQCVARVSDWVSRHFAHAFDMAEEEENGEEGDEGLEGVEGGEEEEERGEGDSDENWQEEEDNGENVVFVRDGHVEEDCSGSDGEYESVFEYDDGSDAEKEGRDVDDDP